MPQLDLESLFCVVGGESRSKVACETIALSGSGSQCEIVSVNAHANDADAPAESRRIGIGGGISWAWSELAGAVLERDDSTKGRSNPKTPKGAPRPDVRRLPTGGKTAVVIGVLPAGKMIVQQRRSPCLGRGWHRPAAGARVFASEAVETEPVSPKVSCFGAVRSESRAATPAPPEKEERSGCWASVKAALHDLCGSHSRRFGELGASESNATAPESPSLAVLSPPRPVVGLGDVKRLASRRWPDTMTGEGRGSV